jgi:hypothetical protein
VHELNQCGTAASNLYNEGLGNFFMDGMFAYEARIVVPSQDVQQRLAAMLASNTPQRMHSPRYNMLFYPFATTYQNSNQWVLESWTAANSTLPIASRAQAQAWLKVANYRPITIEIPAMTRLGARITRANIAFDDQPFDRRMAGHIDTVTVESVVRFVHQVDHGSHDIDIK